MKQVISLSDFKNYLTTLDERLSVYREKIELPVEIYAIGGFSLMYYGLRFSGTEDIDSVKLLQEPVKKLVWEIAVEKDLPTDWLNDIPVSRLFYDHASFRWQETDWRFTNLRLFVIEIDDLLLNKLGVAEKVLMQSTERKNMQDFDDVENILDKLGCCYNSMEELQEWLQDHGINLMDYPSVYDMFSEHISDDGLYWPDGHI